MTVEIVEDPAAAAGLTWAHVVPTLWVASTRLEFVGAVEQIEGGFAARDKLGEGLGIFSDLDTAKNEVAMSLTAGGATPIAS